MRAAVPPYIGLTVERESEAHPAKNSHRQPGASGRAPQPAAFELVL
jgi:hypothetical protein